MLHRARVKALQRGWTAVLLTASACLLLALGASGAAASGIASPGFAVSDFATGFPTFDRFGPMGVAFDSHGTLFAVDNTDGNLYRFSPAGGVAGGARVGANPIPGYLIGLAFGKDESLYVTRQEVAGGGDVAQLNPATGEVIRVVASGFEPLGIATDPSTGDLFVSAQHEPIKRIANPASGSPSITDYGEALSEPDGIVFGPDGTLYTEDGGELIATAGPSSANPGVSTTVGFVSGADGISVAETTNPNEPPFLAVNSNDGSITKVSLGSDSPTYTPMVADGTRGDLTAVGPDSCLYATQLESIEKVTAADGTCPFYPTSPFHCSDKIASVSPASAHVAIGTTGATTVTITGKNLCNGTKVQFGNVFAEVNASVSSPSTLSAVVPANATSGGLSLIDPYGNTGPAVPYALDNYRNTSGFSFGNEFGAPKGDVSFDDVAAAFGSAAYTTWSLCSHCPGFRTPTTEAEDVYAEAQTTLKGGLCFGFAIGSLRLSQGFDKLNNTSDPRRTAAQWAQGNTWLLPAWKGASEPYSSQMRHYLYAQSIRQFSSQYSGQFSAYLDGLKASKNKPAYLASRVRDALGAGLALISLQVNFHDPKLPGKGKNAWDGHELVAYQVEAPQPDGSFNIDVYDPNHPYLASEDGNAALHQRELETSEIHVDGAGNWRFDGDFAGAAGLVWNGPIDQIAAVAFKTVDGQLTPLSSHGGSHAVASGAAVSQITDAHGRSLYDAHGELTPSPSRADVQVMALAEPSSSITAAPPALLLNPKDTYTEALAPGTQNLFASRLDGVLDAPTGGRAVLALGKGQVGITPAKPGFVGLRLTRHEGDQRTTIAVSGTVSGAASLRAGKSTGIVASGTVRVAVSHIGHGPPQTFRSAPFRLRRGERVEFGPLRDLAAGGSTIRVTISHGGARRSVNLVNRASRPRVRIAHIASKRLHGKTLVLLHLVTSGARGGHVLVTVRVGGRAVRALQLAARPRLAISLPLSARRGAGHVKVWAVALTRTGVAGRVATRTLTAH
jgi:hypothetical protein